MVGPSDNGADYLASRVASSTLGGFCNEQPGDQQQVQA